MRYLMLACLLWLHACSSPYRAPSAEISGGLAMGEGLVHRVNAGETLYAIAWIHDMNYSDLAVINNIGPPYTIYPGQMLSLQKRNATQQAASRVTNSVQKTRPRVAKKKSPSQISNSVTPAPGAAVGNKSTAAETAIKWTWPAPGKLLSGFSSRAVNNKGIDLAGKQGDKVLAAAAGEVVYAGSGLLRYGDLVIIKHNARFLSAYAHNSRLLVVEGDKVRGGQKIAEIGSTGIDKVMLHFEIRHDGNPVDPLRYLPVR